MDLPESPATKDDFVDVVGEALHSGLYAVQSRVNGAAQTVNHLAGTAWKADLISAPREAEFGSLRWHAQQVGEGVGGALPYFGAMFGAQRLAATVGSRLLSPTQALTVAREMDSVKGSFLTGAATGLVYDGLTAPIDANAKDFWADRRDASLIGAATYGTATAGWLKYAGRWAGVHNAELGAVMRNPLVSGAISGIGAGAVNAEATTLIKEGKFADWSDVGKTAYTFAFTGATLGALTHYTAPKFLEQPQASAETMRDRSMGEREAEGRRIQNEVNTFGDAPAAVMYNVLRKSSTQLLAVGESHADGHPMRQTIANSMGMFKKAGVDFLAEELPAWMQPQLDHFAKTGAFDFSAPESKAHQEQLAMYSRRDFIMADLKAARQAGVKVVAIDHQAYENKNDPVRNQHQAETLAKLMAENPNSKVLWVGGNHHVIDNAGLESATTQLRRRLVERGESPDKVVTLHTQTNNGTPFNLAPVTRAVGMPVALPIRAQGPLADFNWSESVTPGTKMREFDYLAMYPKRIERDSENIADIMWVAGRNAEVDGDLKGARMYLHDGWDAAQHSRIPTSMVIVGLDLARVERRLGNDKVADYFLTESLKANSKDLEPEDPRLLRLLAEPRNKPDKHVSQDYLDLMPTEEQLSQAFAQNSDKQIAEFVKNARRVRERMQLLPPIYWTAPSDLGRRYQVE